MSEDARRGSLTPLQFVRLLEQGGFVFVRQRGSHAHYRHSDGRWATVPMHRKTLGKGLLRHLQKVLEGEP